MKEIEMEKERLKSLQKQYDILKEEEEIRKKEAEIKKMMEELHPSVKHQAYEKIKSVLGEAAREIKGTPEERAERREKVKGFLEKAGGKAKEAVRELEEREKKREEVPMPAVASETTKIVTTTTVESPLMGYAKSIRESRV
jgi:DNA polymerase III gamma/tau subunit